MGKDIIIVPATGDFLHYKYTLPRIEAMVKKWGVELYIERGPALPWPHGTWLKFDLMDRFKDRENVVVFDADLIFEDDFQDLDLFLNCSKPTMVRDMGQPESRERFVNWCLNNYNTNVELNIPYYNAGVMGWPQKELVQLLDYFKMFNYKTKQSYHEQDFINMFFQVFKIEVNELPESYNYIHVERPGLSVNKINHFVANSKGLIPAYLLYTSC